MYTQLDKEVAFFLQTQILSPQGKDGAWRTLVAMGYFDPGVADAFLGHLTGIGDFSKNPPVTFTLYRAED